MKKKAKLEKDIIDITVKIHNDYPELSKYIAEMPERFLGKYAVKLKTKNFKDYYNSLEEVLEKYSKTHTSKKEKSKKHSLKILEYPASEDMYNKGEKVMDLNTTDLSNKKTHNEAEGTLNEKNFIDDMSGDDLDVPGSELDD